VLLFTVSVNHSELIVRQDKSQYVTSTIATYKKA